MRDVSVTIHDIFGALDRNLLYLFFGLFFCGLITLSVSPLMMAVYGQQLIGYITFKNAIVSSVAIHQVKGNIDLFIDDAENAWKSLFLIGFFYFIYFFML